MTKVLLLGGGKIGTCITALLTATGDYQLTVGDQDQGMLDRLEGKDANNILQGHTDIVPGRPTADELELELSYAGKAEQKVAALIHAMRHGDLAAQVEVLVGHLVQLVEVAGHEGGAAAVGEVAVLVHRADDRRVAAVEQLAQVAVGDVAHLRAVRVERDVQRRQLLRLQLLVHAVAAALEQPPVAITAAAQRQFERSTGPPRHVDELQELVVLAPPIRLALELDVAGRLTPIPNGRESLARIVVAGACPEIGHHRRASRPEGEARRLRHSAVLPP